MHFFVRAAAFVFTVMFFLSGELCSEVHGNETQRGVLVLTFDDGPRREVLMGPNGLLALLSREQIHAAFFVQGWQAHKNPDLVREIIHEGHLVANHTYGHATPHEWARILARKDKKDWKTLKDGAKSAYMEKGKEVFLADAERGRKTIESIVGYFPLFMRPPKWDIDQNIYCRLPSRYIVQMIPGIVDDGVCPKDIQPRQDVNTGDYEVIKRYVKGTLSRDAAIHMLGVQWRKLLMDREARGLHTHILVFHEHAIVADALRILIPEWKKRRIHFASLTEVYGL